MHRFDLLGISANAILSKDAPQERDFLGTEDVLANVCIQTVLPHAHQNCNGVTSNSVSHTSYVDTSRS
jgi:hypothetical protein